MGHLNRMKRRYGKSKKQQRKRAKTRRRHRGGQSAILLSGEAFKGLCKYNLDDRYDRIPIDTNIKESDRVFLKVSDISSFVANPPPVKVTLISSNHDETFTDDMMKIVAPYVTKVYAINCSAKDAFQIPIGFRDNQYTSHKVLKDVLEDTAKSSNKTTLCLVNFLVENNDNERSKARDAFKDNMWVTKSDYMTFNKGKSLAHSDPETMKKRVEYYTQLKITKFVICPSGTGMDTHRIYETLYFGGIPIIKTSFLDPMYKKLGGCWIVNDWSEVTEEECNKRWEERGKSIILWDPNEWLQN
jgi:hypothetical protein